MFINVPSGWSDDDGDTKVEWLTLVSCGKADETCGRGINPEERKKPRGTCLSRGHRTTVFVIAKYGCLDQLHELYSAPGVGMHVGVVNLNALVSLSLSFFLSFFPSYFLFCGRFWWCCFPRSKKNKYGKTYYCVSNRPVIFLLTCITNASLWSNMWTSVRLYDA